MTSTQLRSRHAPAEPARSTTARASAAPPSASGPSKVVFAFCHPEPELARALAGRGIDVLLVSSASEQARCVEQRICVLLDLDAPSAEDAARSSAGGGRHLPSLERIQWEYIHAVLGSCDGNVSEAARQLGIYRQSLQRMLRRHPPNR